MNNDDLHGDHGDHSAAFFNQFLPIASVRCADCRHWRKIRDEPIDVRFYDGTERWPGPHGECLAVDDRSQKTGAWLHDRPLDRSADLSLITRPDFGCQLGERRDERD